MIEKTFAWLRDHFTDQSKISPHVVESLAPAKRSKYIWNPVSKELTRIDRDRPDNAHVLYGVDSLIQYINNLQSDARTNVWVGSDQITVEVIEDSPKDVLTMPFKFHPTFAKLRELAAKPSIPQSEAIKLLRQQFSDFDIGSKAITAVRNLKITKQDEFNTDQSHTASRLGKSLVQTAMGAETLPESLTIKTPVFLKTGNVQIRSIRVWLSIDFERSGNVKFEPDEAEMEDATILEKIELIGIISDGVQQHNLAVYDGEYKVEN